MNETIRVVFFIVYAIVIITFLLYSYIAINHLKTYGYVGEKCQTMINAYVIVSAIIFVCSILAFIFI
jgi:hypothetical protein